MTGQGCSKKKRPSNVAPRQNRTHFLLKNHIWSGTWKVLHRECRICILTVGFKYGMGLEHHQISFSYQIFTRRFCVNVFSDWVVVKWSNLHVKVTCNHQWSRQIWIDIWAQSSFPLCLTFYALPFDRITFFILVIP